MADTQNRRGHGAPTWKRTVCMALISFVIFGGISAVILDWVAATAMGIFMGLFVGILATEGRE